MHPLMIMKMYFDLLVFLALQFNRALLCKEIFHQHFLRHYSKNLGNRSLFFGNKSFFGNKYDCFRKTKEYFHNEVHMQKLENAIYIIYLIQEPLPVIKISLH